jgi:hypothetical protein
MFKKHLDLNKGIIYFNDKIDEYFNKIMLNNTFTFKILSNKLIELPKLFKIIVRIISNKRNIFYIIIGIVLNFINRQENIILNDAPLA